MTIKQALDSVLQRAVGANGVPGVVAMVTDRNGTLYEGAFGERVVGAGASMDADTVGLIASMTKALTSVAAMQLVEQGKLDLDSPASTWLPELADVKVIEGFDADGKPQLRAPKQPVTLRHLLTHTAGFSYEFLSEDVQRFQAATGAPGFITCALDSIRLPLLFDPGEQWSYGVSTDWVGRLVEAASGQRLGEYLSENVLGPLGMNDTAFKLRDDMRARLATIHARLPDGGLAPLELEVPQEPEFDMGGGGLYGTVGDYLKFVRMLLNGGSLDGQQILKPETVEQMSSNQIGDLDVPSLKSANPMFTNDMPMPPGIPHKWGLGFLINTKPLPTGRSAGSLMWAGLANSYYWIDPSSGIAGVLMTQILPFADIKALPLFLEFEATVYQQTR
ncbi:beta-lactamase family protein [Sinimarinibacterium sp. CAU 1509]|uniref:serine hydrolase domain-containing protein n=1 Tax=Sinimarinibacterium sp. CAU 1509 TaxID=2562283 RepID=UPI0010AD68F7|nr:serine hydrolase domain-containing protein [Sinimarinibacterium sp. CAU 1509]TJY63280.1 beta-lactamase family protein [Sinimarinibacterium sp. CAU 1509]